MSTFGHPREHHPEDGAIVQAMMSAVDNSPLARARAPMTSVGPSPVWPMHVAAYVLAVELERSQSAVAEVVGRTRKLVAHAVINVEEARDDAAFDDWMDHLGEEARRLAARHVYGVAA